MQALIVSINIWNCFLIIYICCRRTMNTYQYTVYVLDAILSCFFPHFFFSFYFRWMFRFTIVAIRVIYTVNLMNPSHTHWILHIWNLQWNLFFARVNFVYFMHFILLLCCYVCFWIYINWKKRKKSRSQRFQCFCWCPFYN